MAQIALPLMAAALPLHAEAQTGSARVTTRVDPCVPIDRDSFDRVLAIELGTSIDYGGDSGGDSDVTTVSLSCTAEGIELQVEDAVTRKSMRRVIDLTPVEASARSRLLALTVAEFVVASWVELRLPARAPLVP
ncbi:MAG TPA: hypothetical protein VHZ95_02285, partial [Polyangiales bacterium]|nr:hypothetical protein [Polyangiales bacterium]